jgi:hypothetical protein
MEYGAPLIFQWIQSGMDGVELLDPMVQLHTEVVKWILPMAPHLNIASAVLSLAKPLDRLESLAAMLVRHLGKMAPDHPGRLLLTDWSAKIPWPQSVLLPRLGKQPLFAKLLERATHSGRSEKTESRIWSLELLTDDFPLACLISNRCRVKCYGHDRCLFIDDQKVRSQALQWRCNSFALNKRCICGDTFTRSHVGKCLVARLPDVLPDLLEDLGESRYFCCLDQALNQCDYELFAKYAEFTLSVLDC